MVSLSDRKMEVHLLKFNVSSENLMGARLVQPDVP